MTVIQRRVDNETFYRGWKDYKTGFGNTSASFWIGLNTIHCLTSVCSSGTRLEVEVMRDGITKQFDYSGFTVSNEEEYYLMNYTTYETPGDDSMISNSGNMFSTFDCRDMSIMTSFKGGWWVAQHR